MAEPCGKEIRYLNPKPVPAREGVPIPVETSAGILAPCTKEKGHGGRHVNSAQACGATGPEVDGHAVTCERSLDPNQETTDGSIHQNAHRATGGDASGSWTVEWAEAS